MTAAGSWWTSSAPGLAAVAGRSGSRSGPASCSGCATQPAPDQGQLEAVLGKRGPQTYRWWKTGLDRALAVAAIHQRLGSRIGTGFLVRAGDLGLGASRRAARADQLPRRQRSTAPAPAFGPRRPRSCSRPPTRISATWSSGSCGARRSSRHDASVLRLQTPVDGHRSRCRLAAALPVLEDSARVYIIGHPGGRDLAFSFQDNELLDHEGPHRGQAADPGRVPGSLPRPDRGRQLRQPRVQCQALGGHRAAPQGRQDRHAEAQRRRRAATPPTRASASARSGPRSGPRLPGARDDAGIRASGLRRRAPAMLAGVRDRLGAADPPEPLMLGQGVDRGVDEVARVVADRRRQHRAGQRMVPTRWAGASSSFHSSVVSSTQRQCSCGGSGCPSGPVITAACNGWR